VRYVVRVTGREFDVVLEGDRAVVDGVAHLAALAPGGGGGPGVVYRLTWDDRVGEVAAVPGQGPGRWRLWIEGVGVEAEVEEARWAEARRRARSAGSGTAPGLWTVTAPMPGLVVRVAVEVGQAVEKGAALLSVEAMKMENEVRAPCAGEVRRVAVAPGTVVEKGAALVELMSAPESGGR
jgi:biotin carboxyl carrier protein